LNGESERRASVHLEGAIETQMRGDAMRAPDSVQKRLSSAILGAPFTGGALGANPE
jgi:hypothetical protein